VNSESRSAWKESTPRRRKTELRQEAGPNHENRENVGSSGYPYQKLLCPSEGNGDGWGKPSRGRAPHPAAEHKGIRKVRPPPIILTASI